MSNVIGIIISADGRKAIAELKAVGGQLNKLGGTGTSVSQKLVSAGGSMTRGLTIPLVAAGAESAKLAIDFDTAMTKIGALVGASKKQLEGYQQSIFDLSKATGRGPQELADALYFITSSGFKGADALNVLTASARGAEAQLGDTQTIADLTTSAMNVYGHANLSASQAVDVLTLAVKDGKGEPADYATAMGRVIPVAQNLGVSFDQVGASLASLTLGGFSADKATTGLTSIFTNLAKPSKSAQAALKGVGLSAEGIRTEIRDKGLLPALMDLNKAFDGNQVQLRKVFTSGKAIVPFLSLTGQSAKRNVGIFNDLAHASGALDTAVKKTADSTQTKLNKSLAELRVAGIQAGNALIPAFAPVAAEIGHLADEFSQLSPAQQHFIELTLVTVAALGPVTSTIGNIGIAYKGLASAAEWASAKMVASAATGEAAVAAEATAVEGSMIAINPLFGIATVAVGALAFAFLSSSNDSDTLTQSLDRQKQALDGLKKTTDDARSAQFDKQEADLNAKRTGLEVVQAQTAYNKASDNGTKHTIAAREALLTLQEAELSHKRALREQIDTTAKSNTLQSDARKKYETTKNTVDNLTRAYQKHFDELSNNGAKGMQAAIQVAAQYAKKMNDQADALDRTAAAAQATDPKLAALERQTAAAARAAAALATNLNAVPTHTDIYISTHFAQTTANRGQHKDLNHRAVGGPVTPGVAYQVNEDSGEPEVFVPDVPGTVLSQRPAARARRHRAGSAAPASLTINFNGPIIGDRRAAEALANTLAPHIDRLIRNRWVRANGG